VSDLEFYANFLTRGEILGLGRGSGPEEWVSILGDDYVENRTRKQLHRDFGFIDTAFYGTRGDLALDILSVKVHRLARAVAEVPRVLRDEYGEFPARVTIDDLAAELSRSGSVPRRARRQTPLELERFEIPGKTVSVFVVADREFARAEGRNVGDVWSLSC
jgi:hypothetical protein